MHRLLLVAVGVAAMALGGTASSLRASSVGTPSTPPWRIVYESDAGLDLLSSTVKGSRRLVWTQDNEVFSLSPDGRLVAYATHHARSRRGAATRAGLFVVAVDGTSSRRLLAGGGVGSIVWAPDGSSIAVSRGCQVPRWPEEYDALFCNAVSVLSSHGGKARRVFRAAGQWEPSVHTTSWSPDGRELLIRSGARALWLVRADGSGSRRLSGVGDGFVGDASFSPDGTRIAYMRACKTGLGDDLFCDVAVMSRRGTGKRTVLDGAVGAGPSDTAPLWTSRTAVAFSEWGFGSHVTELDVQSGKSHRLFAGPGRHLTAGTNGRLAFTYQPDWGALDLFVVLDRSGRRIVQRRVPFRFEAAASIWLGRVELGLRGNFRSATSG